MEIRARYVQMGVFTLAVLFAGFSFVYWLNNAGRGIRVGEVTNLELNGADPRQVHEPPLPKAALPRRTSGG